MPKLPQPPHAIPQDRAAAVFPRHAQALITSATGAFARHCASLLDHGQHYLGTSLATQHALLGAWHTRRPALVHEALTQHSAHLARHWLHACVALQDDALAHFQRQAHDMNEALARSIVLAETLATPGPVTPPASGSAG